jgi:hypothetical protein
MKLCKANNVKARHQALRRSIVCHKIVVGIFVLIPLRKRDWGGGDDTHKLNQVVKL